MLVCAGGGGGSMSLNILTELSVNSFNEQHNSAEPLAHAQSVIVMQF